MKKLIYVILILLVIGLLACEKPHVHEYKNGQCECGEVHDCTYIDGKCECGKEHDCTYINGKCECGADEPILINEISLSGKSTIIEGEETVLSVEVKPNNATKKELEWTSSNESLAIVTDGTVKALKEGVVLIKATSKDGSNVEGVFNIKINKALNYREMLYSEEINPVITVISSYNKLEDNPSKLDKTNRIILTLSYVNSLVDYDISNVKCNATLVRNLYDYEYLREYYNEDNLKFKQSHQFSSTVSGSKFEFDTLFTKIEYKLNLKGYEKSKTLEFKTEMLELNESDLNYLNSSDEINDFVEFEKYFSSVSCYNEKLNDGYKVYLNLSMIPSRFEKYKLDTQTFIVDNYGNINPLIGYYNISTFDVKNHSRSTTIPQGSYKYLIVKSVLKYEVDGETKELVLFKKSAF